MSDSTTRGDARLAALYRILGSVAHDISNPLQALVMHAELAADEVGDGGRLRDGELEATRRMQTIVRAMTGLAAAGVHERPVGDAVRRLETLLSRRWTRLGLRMDVDIRDCRNVPVPAAFEEVLLTMGIEISVWLRSNPPRGAVLSLTVDVRDGELWLSLTCGHAEIAEGLCDALRSHRPRLAALDPDVRVDVGHRLISMRCRPQVAAG